jgi:hypothetical protein
VTLDAEVVDQRRDDLLAPALEGVLGPLARQHARPRSTIGE